jgi:hypothetical protein
MTKNNSIRTFLFPALLFAFSHHVAWAAEVQAPIDIQKTVTFKGDFNRLKADFLAKEPLLKLMPNVEHLKPHGQPDTWFYRMKPMGKLGVTHVAEYTAAYRHDMQDNTLVSTWTNTPGTGNADLTGKVVYSLGSNGDIQMNLTMKGSLNKIQVPAVYTMGAGSVTRKIFESNVDQYMKNVVKTYGN